MAIETSQDKITKAFNLVKKKKIDEALLVLDEILAHPPVSVESYIQLARLCFQLKKYGYAIEFSIRADEIEPDNAIITNLLGAAYLETAQYIEAEKQFKKSISLNENLPNPAINMAKLLMIYQRYADAKEFLIKAMSMKPSEPGVYTELAICYGELEEYQESIKYGEKALKLDSSQIRAALYMGRVYSVLGQADTATQYFEKALKLDKTLGQAYEGIAKLRKYSEADRPLINKFKKVLKESMPAIERSHLNFCIGKMLDDCGDWDEAFKFYNQANLLQKTASDYEPPHIINKKMKKVFTKDFFSHMTPPKEPRVTPIFIIGMPRSGTTLIEQIIASHPLAAGAGELRDISSYVDEIFDSKDYPDIQTIISKGLNSDKQLELINRYMEVLTNGRESNSYITDKMPDNFICLGLIHWLFPNAKIIHAIRHPLDTCLSCYFQSFAELPWSYDLKWLAKRYRFYRETMEHWKTIFPENNILNIHYEDLISDPESKIREIINYCGLEWDPVCLDFNKTNRSVKTASIAQVRQPIYKTSRLRFKNYAPHLKDLTKDLSKYLQQDKAMLKECGLKLRPSWWPGS